MSFTTVPQSTLPGNRPTRLETHPSGYSRPRRPSPYPVLPRHFPEFVPTELSPRNSWVVEHDRPRHLRDHGRFNAPSPRPEPRTGRHRRDERPASTAEEAYAARLREIAWDRFLRKTADFATAHVRQRKPSIAVRIASAIKHAFATITRRSRALPTA